MVDNDSFDEVFKVFDEHRHDIFATKCLCDLYWDLSRLNNPDILAALDRNRFRIPGGCQDSVLTEVDIALGRLDPSTVDTRPKTKHPYDMSYTEKQEEALKGLGITPPGNDDYNLMDRPVEEARVGYERSRLIQGPADGDYDWGERRADEQEWGDEVTISVLNDMKGFVSEGHPVDDVIEEYIELGYKPSQVRNFRSSLMDGHIKDTTPLQEQIKKNREAAMRKQG